MKFTLFCFIALTVVFFMACGGMTAKQEKSVEKALAELRKLDAATDIGVGKSEYYKLLINAQAATQEAVATLPDGSLKDGISGTMQTYVDAKNLWEIMKDDGYFFACIKQPDTTGKSPIDVRMVELACNPEGGAYARKYQIPIRDFKTGEVKESGAILKKEGVSIIWKSAKEQLAQISMGNQK